MFANNEKCPSDLLVLSFQQIHSCCKDYEFATILIIRRFQLLKKENLMLFLVIHDFGLFG